MDGGTVVTQSHTKNNEQRLKLLCNYKRIYYYPHVENWNKIIISLVVLGFEEIR